MIENNTFLVTGANGFIGQHLCQALLARGAVIRAVGRDFSTSALTSDQQYPQEIDAETNWTPALVGIDVIIHLAARVHVMSNQAENIDKQYLRVNLHATLNLAQQAAQLGIKRFIFISTIKVNGEFSAHNHTFTELDNVNPQGFYAHSKWQAEQALHELSRSTGMEVVILRPPLVYGPGVKANFARLLKVVESRLPMPFYWINNRRSLIYVGNLVNALISCATHPEAAGQTYLISDNDDVSMPQLVRKIAAALKRPVHLFPFPVFIIKLAASLIGKSVAVDRLTQSLLIDCSKIRHELGWSPPYSMQQGLQATADWYRQQQSG